MSMKRFIRTAVLLGIVLGGAFVLPGSTPTTSYGYDLVTMSAGPSFCGVCSQGGCAGGNHHWINFAEGNRYSNGESDHSCQTGWCADAHETGCEPEEQVEIVRAWQAIDAMKSPRDLDRLLNDFRGRVTYNSTRAAFQVYGCRDSEVRTIVANLPAPEWVVAQLAAD